ncbi:SAV_6107 family HEPN domain-containing protein [Micromonospora craterilacus]|uniref:SAV_6107 family HEPN domain-containing protein n=1 Tax=Micromonospora craterilacus TaxID=1655439 RepID=UPI001314FAF4|nr:SAV_6107 family HEPN domain-containing protein [Micromonospora craterilacus]
MTHLPTVPAHVLPHRTPTQLLAMARQGLTEAAGSRADGLRYAAAHLAALRAAAAVVAARSRPEPGRRKRLTSVWVLLAEVAPELGEWATFFADRSTRRAAIEAGIPRVVRAADADDLLTSAYRFVEHVGGMLGEVHPACCDMHNGHCEPPADLCCRACTEAAHPEHPRGVACVLAG